MFDKIQRYIDDYRGIIRADLFVSVGNACRPAHYLQKFKLRSFSSPFDWMMEYKLEHIAYFLKNDGADFFAKFQEICKDESGYSHRFVQDSQTGMVSMHDFPRDECIEAIYPKFIAKYKRRFANLKNAILKSKHIVFVGNRDSNLQEFKRFLEAMQKIHKAQYIFINVRHNENLATMTRSVISGGVSIIKAVFYNDTHPKGSDGVNPDAWLGNAKYWDKIIRDFRLPFSVVFANFWVRKSDKCKRSLIKRKNTILSILRLR